MDGWMDGWINAGGGTAMGEKEKEWEGKGREGSGGEGGTGGKGGREKGAKGSRRGGWGAVGRRPNRSWVGLRLPLGALAHLLGAHWAPKNAPIPKSTPRAPKAVLGLPEGPKIVWGPILDPFGTLQCRFGLDVGAIVQQFAGDFK